MARSVLPREDRAPLPLSPSAHGGSRSAQEMDTLARELWRLEHSKPLLHAGPTHGRHHDGQPTCRRRERTVSAGAQRFRHIADGLPKMQSPRFFFIQPPIPKHNRQSSCNDTNPATGTARRGGRHITFSRHNVGSRGGQIYKDIDACKSPAQLRPTSRRHPTRTR